MWLFLNDAMLSVVAHRTKPQHLLVRARILGDLERVFPGAKVTRTPDADYLYRAVVTRKRVAAAIGSELQAITYPNFKGSIPLGNATRSRAYHRCWDAMMDAQVELEPGTGGMLAPVPFREGFSEPVDWRE